MRYIIIGALMGMFYLLTASGYLSPNKAPCAIPKGSVSK